MQINRDVLISGHFNVLHPGHIRLFKYAKECGNRLIIAVESDRIAGNAAFVPEKLRLEGVQANSYVDDSFIFDTNINDVITARRPAIVLKGREFEEKINQEVEALSSYGGKLLFSSGESIFSSSDLVFKEYGDVQRLELDRLKPFYKRHNINSANLKKIFSRFNKLRVAVIGDLILDEYILCQALGMSQEDPTIVIAPYDQKKYIGGAGIVAGHASSLGARVNFFTIAGRDENKKWAATELKNLGVNSRLMIDESRPTTLKQRFRCNEKTMMRVSNLSQLAISSKLQNKLFNDFTSEIDEFDLIVLSDFNYGCLPQPLVKKITAIAKEKNKIIVADSQSSSQIGDISRFANVDLLTPTEHEARLAMMDNESGLVVLAENLALRANTNNIFLKLGSDGLLIHSKKNGDWHTDRLEALNPRPRDVAGAGDSLLITAALSLAAGATIWESALIGSFAASLQVSKVGNIPLVMEELIQEVLA
jgi:rfaE bifunctional protein kinase chain/domain